MTLIEEFHLLVGGYYGVSEMDEYILKEYVLESIEKYIRNFVSQYKLSSAICFEEKEKVEKLPLKSKLQDSLLVLNKIDAPLELTLLIRQKLANMD